MQGGAQQKYIALVGELSARDGGGGGGAGEQHILSEVRGNVHVITMNRPAKKNAINREVRKRNLVVSKYKTTRTWTFGRNIV